MDSGTFQIDVTGRGATELAGAPVGKFTADAYDAIKPAGKRRQPSSVIVREDVHLRGNKRRQLIANAADLKRNLAIAAWMVRRHLDYVARFTFQAQTDDRELDRQLQKFIERRSRPTNMDRGRRMTREKFFRLCEARRVLDGDGGVLRLRNGQCQFIKGDLLVDPPEQSRSKSETWESGVRIDPAGAHLEYAIHSRNASGRGTTFERRVPWANFHLYGFFDDGPGDQVRGISPLTSAIADLRDTYEAVDYAKAKIKIAQLLGVKFTRKDSSEDLETAMPTDGVDTDGAGCEDDVDEPRTIDWTHGITTFDLDEGEDVDIVESATPSTEFQNFIRVVIMLALKSLDIPYSFFDEKHTNFHGSRGAWLQYDRSCTDKRDDQIEMRRRWTLWQFQRGIIDGELVLPRRMTLEDLAFSWVPRGFPWWKPSEEVTGSLKAIAGGLDNPERIVQEYDRGSVYDNIESTLKVIKYARDRGIEVLGEPLRLSWEGEFPPVTEIVTETGNDA